MGKYNYRSKIIATFCHQKFSVISKLTIRFSIKILLSKLTSDSRSYSQNIAKYDFKKRFLEPVPAVKTLFRSVNVTTRVLS